jgi:hypothetical protein
MMLNIRRDWDATTYLHVLEQLCKYTTRLQPSLSEAVPVVDSIIAVFRICLTMQYDENRCNG